jgi:hypothetical protein
VTVHGSQTALRNVVLRDCGTGATACLSVDDTARQTGVLLQDVVIRGARGAGIQFGGGVRFHEQSSNLTITETAGVPLDLSPWGVTSIPSGNYTGNQTDAIRVRGGHVSETATWRDPGVPYLAPDGIRVHSSIEPPTLTLEPGVVIRMGLGTTFTVDIGTPHAVGTPTDRIVFSSVTPNVPGSWMGVEPGTWDSPPTRLEHVEIVDAGAGPNGFSGALRLEADLGGVLRNSTIRRSSSCGIILLGGEWVDDYANPAFGNTFVDVAGPDLCRPQ